MSIPVSINRTPTAAARVSRADLLSLQDVQIARYQRGMRAQWTRTIPALLGRPDPVGGWPTIGAGFYRATTVGAAERLILPCALPVGVRIFQVQARIFGGGATVVTVEVVRRELASGASAASILTGSGASSGAWATIASAGSAFGYTIESGYRYWIRVTSGQAGDRCLWVRLVVDRP